MLLDLRERGLSFSQIANTLNTLGIKPPRAKRFTKANVQMTYRAVQERMLKEKDRGEISSNKMWVQKV
jgi:transcriptional regulator